MTELKGFAKFTMKLPNMKQHNGLRGLLAIHVAIFHYIMPIHTYGNVHMPFFFLLSGFSLSVLYGKRESQTRSFLQNRMARCLPIYYLSNVLAVPLGFFGHGFHPAKFWSTSKQTILPIFTWWTGRPSSFNGPAWTVSTLMAFYLVFPFILPLLRSLLRLQHTQTHSAVLGTSVLFSALYAFQDFENLAAMTCLALLMAAVAASTFKTQLPANQWINALFWVQLSLGLMMFYQGFVKNEHFGFGYWQATAWPVFRLPVFAMGCLAGLEAGSGTNVKLCKGLSADCLCLFYAAILVAFSLMNYFEFECDGGGLLQLVVPYLQLAIIVSFTNERPHQGGFSSGVCNAPFSQWLGKVSMSLYLVHMPVAQWFMFFLNGARHIPNWEDPEFCDTRPRTLPCHEYISWSMPTWTIPVVTILALLVSHGLEACFVIPLRNRLRSKPANTSCTNTVKTITSTCNSPRSPRCTSPRRCLSGTPN